MEERISQLTRHNIVGKGSGYSKRNIEQRLRTQRKILEYRFDDRLPEREEELIRCFYLEKIR